jgi:hypothetical protein
MRLYSTTLLQPLNDAATLNLRLDTVQFLLDNEDLYFDLHSGLRQMWIDFDALNAALVSIPTHETTQVRRCSCVCLCVCVFLCVL